MKYGIHTSVIRHVLDHMLQSVTASTVSWQEMCSYVPGCDSFNRFSAGDNDNDHSCVSPAICVSPCTSSLPGLIWGVKVRMDYCRFCILLHVARILLLYLYSSGCVVGLAVTLSYCM